MMHARDLEHRKYGSPGNRLESECLEAVQAQHLQACWEHRRSTGLQKLAHDFIDAAAADREVAQVYQVRETPHRVRHHEPAGHSTEH